MVRKQLLTIALSSFLLTNNIYSNSSDPQLPEPMDVAQIFELFNRHFDAVAKSLFNNQYDGMFDDSFGNNKPFSFFHREFSGNGDNLHHGYRMVIKDINGKQTVIIENLATGEKKIVTAPTIKADVNTTREEAQNTTWPFIQSDEPTIINRATFSQDQTGQDQTVKEYTQASISDKKMFSDIIGQEEAKADVADIVSFLKEPAKFAKVKARMPKGILLVGPPGTGKTLLARALANEADCHFFSASGSDFDEKYVGVGASRVRDLFKEAKENSPSVIFIDEIDALGKRDKDESQTHRQTINELLNKMDGFEQEDNIVVIAATNDPKEIDPALKRSGRFSRIVSVDQPRKKDRIDLWNYYFSKHPVDATINKDFAINLGRRTPGLTGADIADIVNEAAISAGKRSESMLTKKDIEAALDKKSIGQKNHLERTAADVTRTAYHEIGHVTVALKCKTKIPIAKVSILSRGDTGGVTCLKEKYESFSEYTEEELKDKLAALYAGLASEEIFCNCRRSGVVDDIKNARMLAQQMVRQSGMGNKTRNKAFIPGSQEEPYDDDEKELLDNAYNEAKRILTENAVLVHKLASRLKQEETLYDTEIYSVAGEKQD